MLRDNKALVRSLIVDTFGTGAFAAASLVFFVVVRHIGLHEVGTAVTVGTLLSFATLSLADRIVLSVGARNAVALASSVSTIGLICCGLSTGFWSVLGASFVLTLGDRVHSAAWPILASQRFPGPNMSVVFGTFSAIKAATMGIGAALAAIATYQLGPTAYVVLLIVNILTTAVSILFILAVPDSRAIREPPTRNRTLWRTFANRPFLTLLISQACLSFLWVAPTALLPLFITEYLKLSGGVAALVVAIRYLMIFIIQVPIVKLIQGFSRWRQVFLSSLASVLALGAYLLTLVLDQASWVALLVFGGALVALGEMIARPTGTASALRLAPPDEASSYMTTFQLASFAPYAVGPALASLGATHPAVLLWALVAVVIGGAIVSSPLIRQETIETRVL